MNPDGTQQPLNTTGLWPTADRVLVEPMRVAEKTRGGIVLPEASKDKEQFAQVVGTLIAMGETASLCPEMHGIKLGDTVLYQRYTGVTFPIDGVNYQMMKARDIIGKATKMPDSIIRGAQPSAQVFGINEAA